MSQITRSRTLHVRALPSTRETTVYQNGGLFPVLGLTPKNSLLAVLRGGAGHIGRAGRMELVRSLDAGRSWTPPQILADSADDDRNPAFGISSAGTAILAYIRQHNYDAEGNYLRENARTGWASPVQTMVTRSHDDGLTWEPPYPLGVDSLVVGSPFGKIVTAADGTLLMPVYGRPNPALIGAITTSAPAENDRSDWSYLVRSTDDGRTWQGPDLIAPIKNETALLAMSDGSVLALMRGADEAQALASARSEDNGSTWSAPVPVTNARQHPADLVQLSNGDILCTYGNRTPPYRIEGLISRDGGHSWLDLLLTFSGQLYGYDLPEPRRTDLGYPSSVIAETESGRRGVTAYYYNPSLRDTPAIQQRADNRFYSAQDYYAVAITWDEAELIAAVERAVA